MGNFNVKLPKWEKNTGTEQPASKEEGWQQEKLNAMSVKPKGGDLWQH